MSARRGVEITCDGCDFTVPDYCTAEQLRAQLRQQGWATKRAGGKDYCPECKNR